MPIPTWEHAAVIADILVAGGTLGLAYVTYRLAESTQNEIEVSRQLAEKAERQIEATNQQSKVAESALLASIQPLIADVPYNKYHMGVENPGHIGISANRANGTIVSVQVTIPFRNVGLGPARIVSIRLETPRGLTVPKGLTTTQVLPVNGESRAILFVLGSDLEMINLTADVGDRICSLVVIYTNAYGSSPMMAVLDIDCAFAKPDERYIVSDVTSIEM